MQKFFSFLSFLLAAGLILTGCASTATPTAAENYLQTHSQQEITDYFALLSFTFEDFDNPEELSPQALDNFLTQGRCYPASDDAPVNFDRWFDEASFSYRVPMPEIYAALNQYFGACDFGPDKLYYAEYDEVNDTAVYSAVGGGSATSFELTSAEALDAENIKVVLLLYTDEETKYDNPYYLHITAQIVDGLPQFTSCQAVFDNSTASLADLVPEATPEEQQLLAEILGPRQQPEDYYYSPEEVQNILTDLLNRADKANLLYVASRFNWIRGSETIIFTDVPTYDPDYTYNISYGIIDTETQYDEEYAALAREIKTTAEISNCFSSTFTEDVANQYLNNLFGAYPAYWDLPEGLAIIMNVDYMPPLMGEWHIEDYQVWLNTPDKIVALVRYENLDWEINQYRPLNLYLIDGVWRTDYSYTAPHLDRAMPAILPFMDSDMQFPFNEDITPAQFAETYGEPLHIETGEYLQGTGYITYEYTDFAITWLNWDNAGIYTINNIKSSTADFWPELRGVRPGDSRDSVINKFLHCLPIGKIDPVYNEPLLYGYHEHLCYYGLIDGDDLLYTTGDHCLTLTFADGQLQSLNYQSTNN